MANRPDKAFSLYSTPQALSPAAPHAPPHSAVLRSLPMLSGLQVPYSSAPFPTILKPQLSSFLAAQLIFKLNKKRSEWSSKWLRHSCTQPHLPPPQSHTDRACDPEGGPGSQVSILDPSRWGTLSSGQHRPGSTIPSELSPLSSHPTGCSADVWLDALVKT